MKQNFFMQLVALVLAASLAAQPTAAAIPNAPCVSRLALPACPAGRRVIRYDSFASGSQALALHSVASIHQDRTSADIAESEAQLLRDKPAGAATPDERQIILGPPQWRKHLGDLEGQDKPIYRKWFLSSLPWPKRGDPKGVGLDWIIELSDDIIAAELIYELLNNARNGLYRAGVQSPEVELHLGWRMTATSSSRDFEIIRVAITQEHVTDRDWEWLRSNEAGIKEHGLGYLGNYQVRLPGKDFGLGGLGLWYLRWLNRHRLAVIRYTRTDQGGLLTELFIAVPYPSRAKAPRSRLSLHEQQGWVRYRGAVFSNEPVKENTRLLLRELDRSGKLGPLILNAGSGDKLAITGFLSKNGHKVLGIRTPLFNGEPPLWISGSAMIASGDIQNIDEVLASPKVRTFVGPSGTLFDVVVLSDVLYYVDYVQVIEDIMPHLKPGGRFVIVLAPPNGEWDRQLSHQRGIYSVPNTKKALEALGLEIESPSLADPRRPIDTRLRIVARKPPAAVPGLEGRHEKDLDGSS